MSTALAVQAPTGLAAPSTVQEVLQLADIYSKAEIIPQHFRGKPNDCFVIVEMAARLGVAPFMMLQNTYVISGKPGMEGKLVTALVNTSGKFKHELRFDFFGEGESVGCTAWTLSSNGERLEATFKYQEAVAEGYASRNPKWKTMRETMLGYRAATKFGRMYCPERLMGMQLRDELVDMGEADVVVPRANAADLDAALSGDAPAKEAQIVSQPAPQSFQGAQTAQEPAQPEKAPETASNGEIRPTEAELRAWAKGLDAEGKKKLKELLAGYKQTMGDIEAARHAYFDMMAEATQ